MAAQSLFATVFPSQCRLCGAPLNKLSRLPVCDDCILALRPIQGPQCALCGERLATMFGDGVCPTCRMDEPPFVHALAYGSYESGLRELIHLLKYEHVRPAAGVLGRMLGEVIQELAAEFNTAIVVPVPLHASKLRQRGFNQAEEIAKVALKQLKSARLHLNAGVLERRRLTESQTGLTRPQRLENIRVLSASNRQRSCATATSCSWRRIHDRHNGFRVRARFAPRRRRARVCRHGRARA
jgi:predicted amidophosphoribosyltransferase